LSESIFLEVDGGEKVNIDVEYEWIPPTCKKCLCFGHMEPHCPTKETWVPKDKSIEQN